MLIFQSLIEKRLICDQRKIAPGCQPLQTGSHWKLGQLLPARNKQESYLERVHRRRTLSRGSEGSHESTSPKNSFPCEEAAEFSTLHGVPLNVNPLSVIHVNYLETLSAGQLAAPFASSHFLCRSDQISLNWQMNAQTDMAYRQTDMPIRHLKKEVSRPKPYYPGEYAAVKENMNTFNRMKNEAENKSEKELRLEAALIHEAESHEAALNFHETTLNSHEATLKSHEAALNLNEAILKFHAKTSKQSRLPDNQAPISKTHLPHSIINDYKVRTEEDTRKKTALSAGRIAITRCAKLTNAVDLGRYVTVMMDTSYKLASLAIFLYQNTAK